MIKITVNNDYQISKTINFFPKYRISIMLDENSFTYNNQEDYLTKYMRNRSQDQQYNQYEEEHNQYNNEQDTQQQQEREIEEESERQQSQSHLYTSSVQDINDPCDDSFLDLVDNHLQNLKKKTQNQSKQLIIMKQSTLNLQSISLSKQQVSYCLLQNQTITDIIQLTNLFPTKSTAQIINAPFEFRLLNSKNKFLKRDQVQIILEPFESVQIEFQIKKRQNQIGNIYQTLRIDTFQMNEMKMKEQKSQQSKFVKFEITFVKPKFEVNFIGRTSVKRIHQHKVAHLQIYPNQIGEYCINLLFSQDQFSTLNSSRLQKIQCQIETKGYVSIHPNSVILYQNQPLKIVLRKLTQSSGIGKTSVILIKPVNSSLTYVIGVKCMEKVQKSSEQQQSLNINKMSKLMI